MNDSDNIALIGAYLEDAMSPEERADFEARLQVDPALASELRAMQAMAEDSESFYRKEALVDSIAAQNSSPVIKPLWQRPLFRLALAVAAGLVLILTFGPLLRNGADPDNQKLFAEYYETYDESGLSMERGDAEVEALWQEAGDAYGKGAFADAEAGFLSIIAKDSTNTVARFYLANSQLGQGKASQAIPHLQYIIKQEDFLYSRQARWLLALAHLQKNQTNTTVLLLKKLLNTDDAIGKKAKSLLEELVP